MASVGSATQATTTVAQTTEKKLEGVLSDEIKALLDDIENQDEKYVQYEEGLGQDAYFKLLMTQIQHQDPTSPMNNEEMIAQMAQFSIVEQSAKTAEGIEKLVAMMSGSNSPIATINSSLEKIETQLEALVTSFDNMSSKQQDQIDAIQQETSLIQELINNSKAQSAYE